MAYQGPPVTGRYFFKPVFNLEPRSPGYVCRILSILAAVLASVQTFLGYGERSDRHRVAATRYANTRRSIELALTSHDADAVLFIKGEMDRVGGASPQIDRRTWEDARRIAKEATASWRRGERLNLDEPAPKHAPKRPTSPITT